MNNTFLIPTRNKDKFYDPELILNLLKSELPDFQITPVRFEDKMISIAIRKPAKFKGDEFHIIATLSLNEDASYLVNSKNVKDLDEMNMEDLADKLVKFFDTLPDLEKAILVLYGDHSTTEERRQITAWFREYFGCFLFNEGIHPEFIPDDYIDSGRVGGFRRFISGMR